MSEEIMQLGPPVYLIRNAHAVVTWCSCTTCLGNSKLIGDCEKVTLGLLSTPQDNRLLVPPVIYCATGSHELLALVVSRTA